MKRTALICVWVYICLACNDQAGKEGQNTNMADSISKSATEATPGLGNDPTRNDAGRENPLDGPGAVDSSIRRSDAGATPGLGYDPTRNDPANNSSSNEEGARKQDTIRRNN